MSDGVGMYYENERKEESFEGNFPRPEEFQTRKDYLRLRNKTKMEKVIA